MALDTKITAAVANALIEAFRAAANAGSAAVIQIYSGSVPATAGTAISGQTLLVNIVLAADIFSGTSGGVGTIDVSSERSGTVITDGTAAFYRIVTQVGGTTVKQGTVGTTDADMICSTTAFTEDSTVELTSGTITQPLES